MNVSEYLLGEFDREVSRSRHVLEQAPDGKYDWKPHERSMPFGHLADMVATIPSWITMQVTKDELDVAPKEPKMKKEPWTTSAELVASLDKTAAEAREALSKSTDEELNKNWDLKARGEVVQSGPRYSMIQDTINHWAHHRGQMTVYLRLLDAKVPATFGPSADDKSFG